MIYRLHIYLPSKGMFDIDNYEDLGITYTDNHKQEYEIIKEFDDAHSISDLLEDLLISFRFSKWNSHLIPQLYQLIKSVSTQIIRENPPDRIFEWIVNDEETYRDLHGSFIEIIKLISPEDIF